MDHVSVRLKPNQYLVLKEMSEALETPISMLIRTIIYNWLTQNEDAVYRLIDRKKLEKDANYTIIEESEEDIFGDN
jgi:hypothetical protein